MKLVQIQFCPWDKIYYIEQSNLDMEIGDKVIVKIDSSVDLGNVIGFKEIDDIEITNLNSNTNENNKENQQEKEKIEVKSIVRKATPSDLEKMANKEEKDDALKYCKIIIDKFQLPMKLVDVNFSLDNSRITFAFIADGRVDFREAVKDLTRHFNRSIRLHQIGIRDEAKIKGDYGPCGQLLCCKRFLKEMVSITSEMAEDQQIVHRGSERISGTCGRLMCCIAYENEGYKSMLKNLPAIGSTVTISGKKGKVVGSHILKQTVDVEFPAVNGEEKVVLEIDVNKI